MLRFDLARGMLLSTCLIMERIKACTLDFNSVDGMLYPGRVFQHCTALEECAKQNDSTITQQILQSPQVDNYFESESKLKKGPFERALEKAARGNNLDMVQLLLKFASQKTTPGIWRLGYLALHRASLGGHDPI
jgi:hypothetical protein